MKKGFLNKNIQIKKGPILCKILLVTLLLFFFFQAVTSMTSKSAAWDETPNFGIGEYLLKNFKWDVPGAILHPPLSFYLHSIPFLFFNSGNQDIWEYKNNIKRDMKFKGSIDISRGQALLSSPLNENDRLLNYSRLMVILAAMLLGYFIYLWSASLYGTRGAILSLLLFTFSPNLLAHARLITPDMTITAFLFISSYFFGEACDFSP